MSNNGSAYAVATLNKFKEARRDGKIQPDLVPAATLKPGQGWTLNTVYEQPRPGTTLADLAGIRTPFRAHGLVTAGNAAGLHDGATAVILASGEAAVQHSGTADDDPRVDRYGGAIAVGHPLASSGVRIMDQLARSSRKTPLSVPESPPCGWDWGMGATAIWENPQHADYGGVRQAESAPTEAVSEGAA